MLMRIIVSKLVVTPMIRPQPCSSMWPTAARAMKNGPLKLTATTRLHASGETSHHGSMSVLLMPTLRWFVPALLTRTCSPPKRSSADCTTRCASA